MTLRSMQEHRPREREDRKSLMVFQRSAVAADGDIERMVLSRYIGTVLAGPMVRTMSENQTMWSARGSCLK